MTTEPRPTQGGPRLIAPVETWTRPSVRPPTNRPVGTEELHELIASGWTVAEIAKTVGARPDRAEAMWETRGVPNRWISAVRRLAATPDPQEPCV